MTMDERIDSIIWIFEGVHAYSDFAVIRDKVKLELFEAMRDQRHACAEACRYADTDLIFLGKSYITKDKAHQSVMNAAVAEPPSAEGEVGK